MKVLPCLAIILFAYGISGLSHSCAPKCTCTNHIRVICTGMELDDLVSLPSNILSLTVKDSHLPIISKQHLRLPSLTRLDFLNVDLRNITIGNNIPSLKSLQINFNNMSSYCRIDIQLSTLYKVSLNNNGIGSDFSNISWFEITHLHLSANKISEVSNKLLHLLRNVQFLYISDNPIVSFNFSGDLKSLKYISMKNSYLKSVDNLGLKLPTLKSMFLDNSPIEYLDLKEGMSGLEKISMKGTRLKVLDFSDYHLPNIGTIDLAKTPIKILNFTRGLENLEYFDLSYTNITTFASLGLKRIRRISLTGSSLESIDLSRGSSSLQYLFLDDTNLEIFWSHQADLSNLVGLDLAGTPLTRIPHFGPKMKNLKWLNMGKTNIKVFDTSNSTFPSLISLNLHGSPIESINLQYGVENIKNLDLGNTKLDAFNSTSLNTPSIGFLSLEIESLKSVDLKCGLESLKTLRLESTCVKYFNFSEVCLPNLQKLSLSRSSVLAFDLTSIPSTLVTLNISHVKIKYFDSTVVNCKYIKELGLGGNIMEMIDLSHCESLRYLVLSKAKTLSKIIWGDNDLGHLISVRGSPRSIHCSCEWIYRDTAILFLELCQDHKAGENIYKYRTRKHCGKTALENEGM